MLEKAGMDKNHCALCSSDIPFSLVIPSVVFTFLINVFQKQEDRLKDQPITCYFASQRGNLFITLNRSRNGLFTASFFAGLGHRLCPVVAKNGYICFTT